MPVDLNNMFKKREGGGSSSSNSKTDGAGDLFRDLRYGWKGIHDAADAFRGTVNGSIDHVCRDKKGEEREYAIADKGFKGLKETDEHFGWKSGVPADSSSVRINRNRDYSNRDSTSTPGPYSSAASPSPSSPSPTTSMSSSPTSALSPSASPPPYSPPPYSRVPPPLPPR